MPVADKVTVELELRDRQYLAQVRTNERVFERAMDRTGDAAELAERRVRSASSGISGSLKAAAAGIAAGVSVSAITNLADSYTRFANQLRVAGVEGDAFAQVQDRLGASAITNGASLETLGALYGRLSQGAKELGASQADLLQFSDGVAAAIRIQGGAASEASGAILQLTQALSGGTVRAEEFNSINEGARPILQAVADNIDRFGGSVAKLRAEVIDGKLSSQEFFRAFLEGSAALEAKAAKAPLTVAAGFTNLQSALILYVGQSAAVQGATDAVSKGLTALASNLDIIIPSIAAIGTGLGVAYVAGSVAAIATTANFAKTLATLRIAMLAISSHPIIAALSVIAAGFAFVAIRGGEARATTEELAAALDAEARAASTANAENENLGSSLDDARVYAAGLTNETDKLADAHYRAAAAAKAQAIEEARLALVTNTRRLDDATANFNQRRTTLRDRSAQSFLLGV